MMSLSLERHFSKDEILEAYFNEIFLGQDGNRAIHGFGLAAHFYFGKPIGELTLSEQAVLIGMVKGPSAYNPRKNPQRAVARRDLVLGIIRDADLIDGETYKEAVEAQLATKIINAQIRDAIARSLILSIDACLLRMTMAPYKRRV